MLYQDQFYVALSYTVWLAKRIINQNDNIYWIANKQTIVICKGQGNGYYIKIIGAYESDTAKKHVSRKYNLVSSLLENWASILKGFQTVLPI